MPSKSSKNNRGLWPLLFIVMPLQGRGVHEMFSAHPNQRNTSSRAARQDMSHATFDFVYIF
jgi:hypothetical protein